MNLRKYLKVYKKFLHTSLASELEYKTNILVDLITAILSLVGSIFLLSIFFQNNGYIGGWKFEQALIIQAIYTILNGITNTWFNPKLFFCIRINQINLNLSFLTLSSITISCSICILYSLWFFISTTTIWFVKTWNAIEVLRSFLYIGRFPLNSFSFSLRVFFSIFIPIAFITTIPSEVFLGLSVLWKILLEVIVASVFLITSRKFWLFALKFYSSASS